MANVAFSRQSFSVSSTLVLGYVFSLHKEEVESTFTNLFFFFSPSHQICSPVVFKQLDKLDKICDIKRLYTMVSEYQ